MIAFHGDPEIKQKYIDRVKAHAAADEIIKGIYWEDGKGCAVGCTIHGDNHEDYEKELGIPRIIAKIEDSIFENLPYGLAKTWPLRFLEAIPVGKDLSKIWAHFAIFLLIDSTQCASRHPQCDIIAQKYREELEGQKINWYSVASVAYASAAFASSTSAAYTAAYAASASAASASFASSASAASTSAASTSAASTSAASTSAASASAASTSAASAAKEKSYIVQSEKLLELLRIIE